MTASRGGVLFLTAAAAAAVVLIGFAAAQQAERPAGADKTAQTTALEAGAKVIQRKTPLGSNGVSVKPRGSPRVKPNSARRSTLRFDAR